MRTEDSLKPTIAILGTGGTLASIASSRIDSEYDSAAISIGDLVDDLPELQEIANIEHEQVAQIDSRNMTETVWLKLARRVQAVVDQESVDGVVITHGTDTMEETAYFLNLVIQTQKPIVLTGAMRPYNAVSADGLKNLYNAVVLAANVKARNHGVMMALNDVIHQARDVTKMNVNTLDAFQSLELGILGYIHDSDVYFYRQTIMKHTANSEFSINDINELPKVHIIYGHVGTNYPLVDACIADGAKGIISAGVGNGYQSERTTQRLIAAQQQGISIVRCSRVKNGIVSMQDDVEHQPGFVISNMLNPQKARLLLAIALTQTNDAKVLQRIFNEY